jgi:hypothetical protein
MTDWYLDLSKKSGQKDPIESEISNLEEARKDLAMVNIYYKELSYTAINETKALTILTVLSNYGGQLGLFVGMSLMSFFHLFEIIFGSFWILIKKVECKNILKI